MFSSSEDDAAKPKKVKTAKRKAHPLPGEDVQDAIIIPGDVLLKGCENGIQGIANYPQPKLLIVNAAILGLDAKYCIDCNRVRTTISQKIKVTAQVQKITEMTKINVKLTHINVVTFLGWN